MANMLVSHQTIWVIRNGLPRLATVPTSELWNKDCKAPCIHAPVHAPACHCAAIPSHPDAGQQEETHLDIAVLLQDLPLTITQKLSQNEREAGSV